MLPGKFICCCSMDTAVLFVELFKLLSIGMIHSRRSGGSIGQGPGVRVRSSVRDSDA